MTGRNSIALLFLLGSCVLLLLPVREVSQWQNEYHILATTTLPPLSGGETETGGHSVAPAATLMAQRQQRQQQRSPVAIPAAPVRPAVVRLPQPAGPALPVAPALSSSDPRAPPVLP